MPARSPAYNRFCERLNEVWHLYKLCRAYRSVSYRGRLGRSHHVNALTRSAIVLLSSHVQGFIEDYAEQIVDRLVADCVPKNRLPDRLSYYAARQSIDRIKSATDPDTLIGEIKRLNGEFGELFYGDGSVPKSLVGTRYKDGFGNPTVREIRRFFRRFGYETYDHDLRRQLKRDYLIVCNAVDQVVEQRTKIAHGDTVVASTPKDLGQYVLLTQKFCSRTDLVAGVHFRRIGCRI